MNAEIATINFSRWENALLTRDPTQVAVLYCSTATLLPTMAKELILDQKGIIEYFTFFESFEPTVVMIEEHVELIDNLSYLHCGVYRFTLTIEGEQSDVDARFTMIWQKTDDEWKVLHHHSSRVPVVMSS